MENEFQISKRSSSLKEPDENAGKDQAEDCEVKISTNDRSPLDIVVVLHQIFGLLSYRDIKSVRFVCKQWNFVAEPYLRKMSKISFYFPWARSKLGKKPVHYDMIFKSPQSLIPFSTVELKNGVNDGPWPENVFVNFFAKRKNELKELSIFGIEIENCGLETYDLSTLLKMTTITKLKIHCQRVILDSGLQFGFQLDAIMSVKYLSLYKGKVIFTNLNGKLYSPVEIDLDDCDLIFPNENGGTVLNHYIDFQKVKLCKICPSCRYHNKAILDLVGEVEIDYLNLREVRLSASNDSNWKIHTMILVNQTFGIIASLNMEVMTMKFIGYLTSMSTIFPIIPTIVEKLFLEHRRVPSFLDQRYENRFLPSKMYPSLKYLSVSTDIFYDVKNCPNLVSLEITDPNSVELVDIKYFPKSLQNIKLNGPLVVYNSEIQIRPIKLERLILNNCSFEHVEDVFVLFQARKTLLRWKEGENLLYGEDVLNFLIQDDRNVAFGPIDWELQENCFEISPLLNLVDKRVEFYEFNGLHGRAISSVKFAPMTMLEGCHCRI